MPASDKISPLPLWEREGPAAQRREGEGAAPPAIAPAAPSPSQRFALGPSLSHKGRGDLGRSCIS
jgi:hypothetical protein